jgi:hypothetical protein
MGSVAHIGSPRAQWGGGTGGGTQGWGHGGGGTGGGAQWVGAQGVGGQGAGGQGRDPWDWGPGAGDSGEGTSVVGTSGSWRPQMSRIPDFVARSFERVCVRLTRQYCGYLLKDLGVTLLIITEGPDYRVAGRADCLSTLPCRVYSSRIHSCAPQSHWCRTVNHNHWCQPLRHRTSLCIP